MRKITMFLIAMVVFIATLSIPGLGVNPAEAHHPIISGSAVCNPQTGNWEIQWTVGNSESWGVMTVKTISRTISGVGVGTVVEKSGEVTGSEELPGSTTGQLWLTVRGRWPNGVEATRSGSVRFSGTCVRVTETPTPTEEVTPEVTPTEEVTPEVTPTEEVTPEVTPTEEVTPEVTPTEEVTPEVTPTEEVTPEITPTETATPGTPPPSTVIPTDPPQVGGYICRIMIGGTEGVNPFGSDRLFAVFDDGSLFEGFVIVSWKPEVGQWELAFTGTSHDGRRTGVVTIHADGGNNFTLQVHLQEGLCGTVPQGAPQLELPPSGGTELPERAPQHQWILVFAAFIAIVGLGSAAFANWQRRHK